MLIILIKKTEYLTSTLVRRRRIRYSLFDTYSPPEEDSLFAFLRVFSSIKLAASQAGGGPEACELQTGKKRRMARASFRYYQLITL